MYNLIFYKIITHYAIDIYFRGLGIETVFANVLRAYLDPGNLIIVLGTTSHDEQYLIDTLKGLGNKQLPRVVTFECSSDERLESNSCF